MVRYPEPCGRTGIDIKQGLDGLILTQGRTMRINLSLSGVLLIALVGCSEPPIVGYAARGLDDAEVATLMWSSRANVLNIDGEEISAVAELPGFGPPTSARLAPGEHTIIYGRCRTIGAGSMFYARARCSFKKTRLAFEAGHQYRVSRDLFGSRVTVQDSASGRILDTADLPEP